MMRPLSTRAYGIISLALAALLPCHPLAAHTPIEMMIETLEARGINLMYRDRISEGPKHRLRDVTITVRPHFGLFLDLIDNGQSIQVSLDDLTVTEIDPAKFQLELPSAGTTRIDARFFGEHVWLVADFALGNQAMMLDIADGEIDFNFALARAAITSVQTGNNRLTTSALELVDYTGTFTMTGPVGQTDMITYTSNVGGARRVIANPANGSEPMQKIEHMGSEFRIIIAPQRQAVADLFYGIPVMSGSYRSKPSVFRFLPEEGMSGVTTTVQSEGYGFDFLLDETRILLGTDLDSYKFLMENPDHELPVFESDGHTALFSILPDSPDQNSIASTLKLQTGSLRMNDELLRVIDPDGLLTGTAISHDIELGMQADVTTDEGPVGGWQFDRFLADIRAFDLNLLGTIMQAEGRLELVGATSSEPDLIGRLDLRTRNFRDLVEILGPYLGEPGALSLLLDAFAPNWQADDGQIKRYIYIFEPGDRMTVNGQVP
ncbi:MAG: hypothetical protein OXC91_08430 [Rhodobacteraceae bacterium]|nr:hypothetical protein [Paracoccaceae bacterium]